MACAVTALLSVPSYRMCGIARADTSIIEQKTPIARRERQMQKFKSAGQAQHFLWAHGIIYGHFQPRCHLMAASHYRRCSRQGFPDLARGDVRPNGALMIVGYATLRLATSHAD
jgi:hypothetical protein